MKKFYWTSLTICALLYAANMVLIHYGKAMAAFWCFVAYCIIATITAGIYAATAKFD